jgi:hypothetical protein
MVIHYLFSKVWRLGDLIGTRHCGRQHLRFGRAGFAGDGDLRLFHCMIIVINYCFCATLRRIRLPPIPFPAILASRFDHFAEPSSRRWTIGGRTTSRPANGTIVGCRGARV